MGMSICGGVDWGLPAGALFDLSAALGLCFISYIAFTVFCVLNIMTGIFVESAQRLSARDDDQVYMDLLEMKRQWHEEVTMLFDEADIGGQGVLTCTMFEAFVTDFRVQVLFNKLGVDVGSTTARTLFNLLDLDQNGEIDKREFAIA